MFGILVVTINIDILGVDFILWWLLKIDGYGGWLRPSHMQARCAYLMGMKPEIEMWEGREEHWDMILRIFEWLDWIEIRRSALEEVLSIFVMWNEEIIYGGFLGCMALIS